MPLKRPMRSWAPLILVLATRLTLGLTYSFITPAWEAYDEDGHFAYARYIAQHHTLLQAGDPEAERVWEKFQPPFYYLLIAPAITGFDLGQTFQLSAPNPYFVAGNAGFNYQVHPDYRPEDEPTVERALHVARTVTVILTTVSVIFVYLTACYLWPTRRASVWAATLLYAFWPQFLFVGSMVTNDALVTALATMLVYFSIRLASEGFRWRVALAMGITLAAALLTKLNALAFILPATVALFLSLSNYKRWRSPRTWLPALGLGLLVLSSVWILNSFKFVTSHVFQSTMLIRFLNSAGKLISDPASGSHFLISALEYSFQTFLASFGWGNLETYSWLYRAWAIGAGLSLILSLIGFIKIRKLPPFTALLGLQVISLVALTLALAIIYRNIYLLPGRYLLPGLAATSLLLLSSWQQLKPPRLKGYLLKIVSLGLVLVSWSIPFETIAPAYTKPQPLKNVERLNYPMHIFFNQEIELLGAIRPPPLSPDSQLDFSLCWQALTALTHNYSVSLEVIGPDGEGYGQLETYPGRGNYPTSFWKVNQPFCDDYTLHVRGDVPSPAAATIRVLLLDSVRGDPLSVTNSSGEAIDPNLVTLPLKIKSHNDALPMPSHPVNYRFGEGINLIGYDLTNLAESNQVRITLYWEALEDIADNDVIFIHLRDTPNHVYAQNDSQPRHGWYPTSLWESGEVILDEHTLTLSEQTTAPLDVYLGLYDPATGIRLAVFDAEGNPLVNDEVKLMESLELKNRP